jgi:hypothetical protein
MLKHLLFIVIVLTLSACTSVKKGDSNSVEVWEHFSDISSEKVNRLAREHCQMYGKQAQLADRKSRAFLDSEYDEYQFRCIEKPVVANPIFQPAFPVRRESVIPAQGAGLTIETAAKKCEELGFKSGTEAFGNCVLKLSK